MVDSKRWSKRHEPQNQIYINEEGTNVSQLIMKICLHNRTKTLTDEKGSA